MRTTLLIICVLVLSGALGFITSMYTHWKPMMKPKYFSSSTTHTRQTFHSPATFVKQLKGDPLAGKKIFREFCASCHASEPLIDVSAPRINDKKLWNILKKQGLPTLLKITINGAGAMPARGGCFECSDKQLAETINYILSY